jgi:hypothetical protein
VEQAANGGALQRFELQTETMQEQIRTLCFDCQENIFDLIGASVACKHFRRPLIDRELRVRRTVRDGPRKTQENTPVEQALHNRLSGRLGERSARQ